jgi:PHD/YefM family antitoxin component YafN of YafNO toxin-antitoxin module
MAERWLVDENGQRTAVVIEIGEYNHMIEDLEELEDIRAADEAKESGEQPIPIEQAIAEIEHNRK